MKYIIKTTIAIFISLNLYAQYDCSTARTIPQLDTCYQGYVNDSITELWFTFNVNDSSDYLIGFNQISGLPSAHPHSLRLYKGLCNSLSLMDSDTISLNDTILNVTTNGNGTYFLKITKAKAQTCSLYECKMSKSYFNLCFENTLLSSPLTVYLYSPTNPIIICSAMGITGWDCNSPVFSDCTYKPAQVCVGDVINFEVKNTPSSFNSTQGVIFKLYDNNFSLLGSSFITPPYTSNYFTVPFNNTGVYYVEASWTPIPNCEPLNTIFKIEVYDKPVPSFNIILPQSQPYCINDGITFENTSTGNPQGQQYQEFWDFGDGNYGYGQTVTNYYSAPGYYNVTLTVSNQCGTSTVTQQIYVGPTPDFTATTVCEGDVTVFNNLTDCQQYINSWLWDFGDGTSSTLTNPTHLYSAPGTYNVTLTINTIPFNNSYSITKPVVVYPAPQLPIITGSDLACDNTGQYCISNASPLSGFTYTWNVTNGIPQAGTGICLPINWNDPLQSGLIEVTVTDPVGCSSISVFEVKACCQSDASDFVFNNTDLVTYMQSQGNGNGPYSFSNKLLTVNGQLILNQDLTLFNSIIEMGKDAQIIINPGYKLNLDQTIVRACGLDMWDRILISDNSSKLILNNAMIKDGKRAVHSENGGVVESYSGTIFDNNYIAVLFDQNIPLTNSSFFTGTKFLASSNLKNPYSTRKAKIGISINNVRNNNNLGIQIGDPNNLLNEFNGLEIGIIAYNSITAINNNKFINIQPQPPIVKNSKYGAIVCDFSIVPLGLNPAKMSIGNTMSNTFDNCKNGIYSLGGWDLTINENIFNNNVLGIYYTKNNNNQTVLIEKNIFNDCNIAIYSLYNVINKSIIQNNKIYQYNLTNGTGIQCLEIGSVKLQHNVLIYNNKIYNAANGIYCIGLRKPNIVSNTINIYTNPNQINTHGILLFNTFNGFINSNNVFAQNRNNYWTHGIRAESCAGLTVSCNKAVNTGNGFTFSNVQPGTYFAKNDMVKNYYGLTLNQNGEIGPQLTLSGNTQLPNDNRWLGTYNGYYHTATFYSNGPLSPLYVRTIGNIYIPTYNLSLPSTYNAFSIYQIPGNLNALKCPVKKKDIYGPIPPGEAIPLGLALKIAKNLNSYTINDMEAKWWNKYHLYTDINRDGVVISDTTIINFNDSINNVNLGRLETINKMLANPSITTNDILSAKTNNQNINPNNSLEICFKTINEAYVEYIETDSISVAKLNQIKFIAELCPYIDGPAVYNARVLLAITDSFQTFENACETINFSTNNLRVNNIYNDTVTHSINNILVYPNPASISLNVDILLEHSQLTITDLNGKIVFKSSLVKGLNTINIAHLSNGVYITRIENKKNIIYNDKLVIIK